MFDGSNWNPVSVGGDPNVKPIAPILDGDGKIFVSIVSYRGTLFYRRWTYTNISSDEHLIVYLSFNG